MSDLRKRTQEQKASAPVNLGDFLRRLKEEGKLTVNEKGWLVISERDAAQVVLGMMSDKIKASPNEDDRSTHK